MSKEKLRQLLKRRSQKWSPGSDLHDVDDARSPILGRQFTTKRYSHSEDGQTVSPDTWIYVGDVCYKVHRNLLCQYGEYFKALFSFEGYNEDETKEIEFCGRTPTSNAFTTFVEFVYKRTFSCADSGVLEFLLAADFLQITTSFLDALSRCITKENWAAVLEIAVTFESKRLEDAVYKYVESNFGHVHKTKAFKQLRCRHKKLQQIHQSHSQSRHQPTNILKLYKQGLCDNQQLSVDVADTMCIFC